MKNIAIISLITMLFGLIGNPVAFAGNRNPCMANPCAKNPCMSNPCMANPCAANPCSSSTKSIRSNKAPSMGKLIAMGKMMWNDPELGTSGVACMNCHEGADKLNIEKHGGVFPHPVKMAKDIVTLDQMINFCMINPMETEPLDPNSVEMTAMAAYYQELVKRRKHSRHMNPCMKNPCGR